jgi:ribonuclease P protein component
MSAVLSQATLPKTARLLKSRDFFFRPCERFQTEHFRFFYTREGKGRMGVSLSKKVLRNAVARNRVRRLLKEVFREERADLTGFDLHVVGREGLKADWAKLNRGLVEKEFQRWETALRRS